MKLHLASTHGLNLVTGYGDDYVQVNGAMHRRSFILLPTRTVEDWVPPAVANLCPADLAPLLALGAEILLLGTGPGLTRPSREVLAAFASAGLGVEIMDTHAACRTFNILVTEGREVAAALWIQGDAGTG